MKTKKSLQKPIDFDVHLKYQCRKCGYDHWLSYREASTKNFKIVCYCGKVYRPKRVIGFKLKYEQSFKEKPIEKPEPLAEKVDTPAQIETPQSTTEVKVVQTISEPSKDLLDKTSELLISYGFTPKESVEVVKKVYGQKPCDDYVVLVKNILESLRS